MLARFPPILAASVTLAFAACGTAQARVVIPHDAIATVCPAGEENEPPAFDRPGCFETPLARVDPQGRDIWIRLIFDADESAAPPNGPAGFFVSVKASSAVWLNGAWLGANGAPGPDRKSETPGRMDAVFYAPHEAVRIGENELVMRLSSHHGFLHLKHPVHYLVLGRYADPSREILRAYGPSLMTFGAFLLGAIYFGMSALRGAGAGHSGLLFLLSLIAIAQLGLETSRGLFPYDYPFHDYRLVLITVGAVSFGVGLLIHTAFRFLERQRGTVIAGGVIATALAIIIPDGFDPKAVFGLLTPVSAGAAIAIHAAVKKQPAARAYAVALTLFLLLTVVFIGQFLDAGIFYSVAALFLFLIGQQALLLAKERALRLDASDRARRLEIALEQARQKDAPERLKIQSAGKTDIVAARDIVYCKGAGDYVEVFLADGTRRLHLAKLHELEKELPQTFLRVHRSYIVNTNHVRALTRESNGVGSLSLANGETVPVSRRILPNVRSALQ